MFMVNIEPYFTYYWFLEYSELYEELDNYDIRITLTPKNAIVGLFILTNKKMLKYSMSKYKMIWLVNLLFYLGNINIYLDKCAQAVLLIHITFRG